MCHIMEKSSLAGSKKNWVELNFFVTLELKDVVYWLNIDENSVD